MQLALGYSIKQFLGQQTGVNAILVIDGVELPTAKPFITVEDMQNNNEYISKQRETVETTYRFQVGVRADSHFRLKALQSEIRELFLFGDIPLYDENGVLVGGTFQATVTSEVPIKSGDISDKTNQHRLYFDVEVERNSHKNKGAI